MVGHGAPFPDEAHLQDVQVLGFVCEQGLWFYVGLFHVAEAGLHEVGEVQEVVGLFPVRPRLGESFDGLGVVLVHLGPVDLVERHEVVAGSSCRGFQVVLIHGPCTDALKGVMGEIFVPVLKVEFGLRYEGSAKGVEAVAVKCADVFERYGQVSAGDLGCCCAGE